MTDYSEVDRFDTTGRERDRLVQLHRDELRAIRDPSAAASVREDLLADDSDDSIFDPRTGARIDPES